MTRTPAATKASKSLLDKLNEAISQEIQISIQYMWQHILWSGIETLSIQNELKSIALAEMKHAEAIAERLYYLGDKPTAKPAPIFVGNTLKDMMGRNLKDKEGAITLYNEIAAMAHKEGDETTNRLFREILRQEEDHHNTFTTLMEDL